MLYTGRIYFPYLPHPVWLWGPSNILSCGPQECAGQRMKMASYCHLALRLEMHYCLSAFVEQFLVHIFLRFNFNCWKSSYMCVEVEGSRCLRSYHVLQQSFEWFIVAFQAHTEQLLFDCNLAICDPSSTIQQTHHINLLECSRLKHACYTS